MVYRFQMYCLLRLLKNVFYIKVIHFLQLHIAWHTISTQAICSFLHLQGRLQVNLRKIFQEMTPSAAEWSLWNRELRIWSQPKKIQSSRHKLKHRERLYTMSLLLRWPRLSEHKHSLDCWLWSSHSSQEATLLFSGPVQASID